MTENGFMYLPKLNQIDMRDIPLETFPSQVFKTTRFLRTVYADNYKLCCRQNLPDSFETGSCFAPVDEISSCYDLLRSDVYRVFLWLFCALSITGNTGCFLFRQLQKNVSVSGFSVFVTNLSISDLLMDVYLAIVVAADETYRSTYLWNDLRWRVSPMCKVAGFLSLLSSEVSAFIICLITLDRFIVLRFPFSEVRFQRRSASLACGLVWAVGITLAGVPLLPFMSEWEFYSQNGICIPLPITRKSFKGRAYSFGVMIVFNMVLFVFIAVGQVCIYWSVRMNSMDGSSTKKSKDIIIARRLATVVVSDFLCWFPVGMLSIMAAVGIPVPSEASVALVIFVLPLNSALNPFLYTFNLLLEKWNRAEEKRMLKKLELTSSVD
ncbi:G-protein coupled receptor GRL101-like [Pomacea canaliculata]|uniref:G-protein coupled receptor GRL101-like n=1 Tax=Pomacea canaliculata TaxID=400727 RepID=UPI000D73BE8E|nr:G-protein coupled receptor GRL101-like [Pomacea canaliculata]